MTTVKEFKKWLDRFPDDTIVNVAIQHSASLYQSYGEVTFEDIDLKDSDVGDGWEFVDFVGNRWVKEDEPHYNKKYLHLGER